MYVEFEGVLWVVLLMCGVWFEVGFDYMVQMSGDVQMCMVFVELGVVEYLFVCSCVVEVYLLLCELIFVVVDVLFDYVLGLCYDYLMYLLFVEVIVVLLLLLYLLWLYDVCLWMICDMLVVMFDDLCMIVEWVDLFGLLVCMLYCVFWCEMGFSFCCWCEQVWLLFVFKCLVYGEKVLIVVMDYGYSSQSVFFVMFKWYFGMLLLVFYV